MSEDTKDKQPEKKQENVDIKEVHKKIEIKVDRDPEIDSLQKELAEYRAREAALKKKLEEDTLKIESDKKELESELGELKAEKQQRALEEFEKKKTSILAAAKESKLGEAEIASIEEKLADPKNLAIVEGLVSMMIGTLKKKEDEKKADTPPAKPSGKAPFTAPADAQQYESAVEMIDDLYDRAYYKKDKYTVQEQEEAKAKIETLISTFIKSPSWQQLKKGKVAVEMPKIISCPSCGRTIIGNIPPTCPKCGFNFSKTGDVLPGTG